MSDDLRANPYVGLRPFFKEDSLYFFGREEQTAAVLDILRKERFVGVVGSSGTGKSSLVYAGVLPSLLGGFLVQDRDRWRIATIKPGDNPLGNLAAGLLQAMGDDASEKAANTLRQQIVDSHLEAVVQYLAARLEANTNLFLLVDQFEEIFAFRGSQEDEGLKNFDSKKRKERARRKGEAADFVDLILALSARRELPVYVVLTMRTDFMGDCDVFYSLPEALNRGRYLVPRMSREQLRDAVECPPRLLGVDVGTRLVDHVLNQLGDRFDRLPVLQHALLRTWDEWERNGGLGPLDLSHFEAAGGLEGALNRDAESALWFDMDLVERVFRRLTGTDGGQRRIRTPARISEIITATGANRDSIEQIILHFSENDRNFVRKFVDGKLEDPRVDISHESVIRQWERLSGWMDSETQARDEYRELVKRARRWERNPRFLLRDPELEIFLAWKNEAGISAGWAGRYSSRDDDFELAIKFLEKSVVQRDLDSKAKRLQVELPLQKRYALAAFVIFLFAALTVRELHHQKALAELDYKLTEKEKLIDEKNKLVEQQNQFIAIQKSQDEQFCASRMEQKDGTSARKP